MSELPAGLAERLRAICLALPEVTERPSHGAPTWFVRGKKSFGAAGTGGTRGPHGTRHRRARRATA